MSKRPVFVTDRNPEGAFDIIQPLGKGAFGVVYKAMLKRDGELVALKIMPAEADKGPLEDEVRILQRLKSPYIVNFKAAFLYEGNIWLAMEYCGGGAILDIMKVSEETLTEEQIQVVMRESLKGLYYLHGEKVIHRDIKAGNILVNHKGQCKLADFGVSKNLENTMAKAQTAIGSPYWMAPEVFSNEQYGPGVDIWSLGITAMEMALGRPPLSHLHPLKAVLTIPRSDPPRLPEGKYSQGFEDFIANCLVKDWRRRPTAQQLFRHSWIRRGKGLRIIQQYVTKNQPLLDAWRKQMREEDEESEDEDHGYGDDDEEDDDFGGTMLVANGGGDSDDEEEDDQFATSFFTGEQVEAMQEADEEPEPAKAPPTRPLPNPSSGRSSYNRPLPSNPGRTVIDVRSVFSGEDLETPLHVPASLGKSELIAAWNSMKRQHNADARRLQAYYDEQLTRLQDMIDRM